MSRPGQLSHASLEQAAHWYVRLQAPGGALEQLRWQTWVAQSPEHLAAWQYVQRVSQRFAPLLEQPHGASRALRSSRRQTLKTLLVLGVGSTLAWGTWRHSPLPRLASGWSADYATANGETRDALLTDGSHVWLNALSALDEASNG